MWWDATGWIGAFRSGPGSDPWTQLGAAGGEGGNGGASGSGGAGGNGNGGANGQGNGKPGAQADLDSGGPADDDDDGTGEMTYLCDSPSNGAGGGGGGGGTGPDAIDCEKLSWAGLPGSSDLDASISLTGADSENGGGDNGTDSSGERLGKPQMWSQGTCTLAVASSIPGTTTIRWANVLAAFETLTNLCVANPVVGGSRGGSAYWGRQSLGSWIHGKKGRKRRRRRRRRDGGAVVVEGEKEEGDDGGDLVGKDIVERDSVGGVDGSMALPKGVNVTVFRSGQAQCEWVLAQEGKDGDMCNKG